VDSLSPLGVPTARGDGPGGDELGLVEDEERGPGELQHFRGHQELRQLLLLNGPCQGPRPVGRGSSVHDDRTTAMPDLALAKKKLLKKVAG